jgi:hypothetical protein
MVLANPPKKFHRAAGRADAVEKQVFMKLNNPLLD